MVVLPAQDVDFFYRMIAAVGVDWWYPCTNHDVPPPKDSIGSNRLIPIAIPKEALHPNKHGTRMRWEVSKKELRNIMYWHDPEMARRRLAGNYSRRQA